MGIRLILAMLAVVFAGAAFGQTGNLAGLARAYEDGSYLSQKRGGLDVVLNLSQAVPYSVRYASAPFRVIVEFNEVDLADLDTKAFAPKGKILSVTKGRVRPGLSRLILETEVPFILQQAGFGSVSDTPARSLELTFLEATEEAFAKLVKQPVTTAKVQEPQAKPRRNDGSRPWRIVLDPGHGGLDPGADGGRRSEADLMLLFAFDLRDALQRFDEFEVFLTREADVFVGLDERLTRAHDAKADVLISLHADAVEQGYAEGVTLYTLSHAGSAKADDIIASRHDRTDILAGVDLVQQPDEIAEILMDITRREIEPRSRSLSQALVEGFTAAGNTLSGNAQRSANFSVLRAPDFPAILVELGFLSSDTDRERLYDREGRQRLIDGFKIGLLAWATNDAATLDLIRQ